MGNWKKANAREYRLGWNWRAFSYLALVTLLIAITTFIGYSVFFGSPEYDGYITYSTHYYWLHNFSDSPGVRAYAEQLLKDEHASTGWLFTLALLCALFPITFTGVGFYSLIRRKFGEMEVASVTVGYICLISFLGLALYIYANSPRD
jgi:hypothetical protein